MANKHEKTITLNGKTFEVPELELYCEKCETTNFFYSDNKPPYKCDNCGESLDAVKDNLRQETPHAHS
jgi:ribosomal protein S27E